eukprot:gene31381-37931_t
MSSPPRPPPPRPPPPGLPGRASSSPTPPPPPRSPPPPPVASPMLRDSPVDGKRPNDENSMSDSDVKRVSTPPPPRPPPTPPPPKPPASPTPNISTMTEPSREEKVVSPSQHVNILEDAQFSEEPLQSPPTSTNTHAHLTHSAESDLGKGEGERGNGEAQGKMASEQAQAYLLSLKRTLSPSSVEEKEKSEEVVETVEDIDDTKDDKEVEEIVYEGEYSRVPFSPSPSHQQQSAGETAAIASVDPDKKEEKVDDTDDNSFIPPLSDLLAPHLRTILIHIHKQLASITETIASMDRDGATKFMHSYKDTYNTAYLHQLHHTYMMLLGGSGAMNGSGNAPVASATAAANSASADTHAIAGDSNAVGVGAKLFSAHSDEPVDIPTQTNKFYIDNPIPNFKAHMNSQTATSSSTSLTPYTLLDSQEHVENFSMGDVKEMLGSLFVCTNKALTHTISHPHIQAHFNTHKNYIYSHIKNLYAQKLVSVENALDKYCYYAQERVMFTQNVHDEILCRQLDKILPVIQKEVQSLYGHAMGKLESLKTVYAASYQSTVENYIHNLDMVFKDTRTHTEVQESVYRNIFTHVREEMGRCKLHYESKREKGWDEVKSGLAKLDEMYLKLYGLVYDTFVGRLASKSSFAILPSAQRPSSPTALPTSHAPSPSIDAYMKAFYKYKQHLTNLHTKACATLYGEMESLYVGYVEELCGKVCKYRMMVYEMEVYDKQLSLYLDYLKKKTANAQRKKKELSLQNIATKTSSTAAVGKLSSQASAVTPKQGKQQPSSKYSPPSKTSNTINDVNTQDMNASLEELMHYANCTYPPSFTLANSHGNNAGSSSSSHSPILRMGSKLKVACELAGYSAKDTLDIMLQLYASTKLK